MPEEESGGPSRPAINFDSSKAAPTILTIGALLWRVVAWWEDIDFILSIREEKIAMTLQVLLDWGWLVFAIVGVIWALGAYKTPQDATKVHWGMVTAVGILAFMAGTLITVRAIGSVPVVLTSWGGEPNTRSCNATIDTSRLVGLKDKHRVILLCGVVDPRRDPIEDDRIAVSQPFTITGQVTMVVASYGTMERAIDEVAELAKATGQIPGPNQAVGFALWHSAAVIPSDLNITEIKRVSDVVKRGGKIVTEPQAGAYSNQMPILTSPIVPLPTTPAPKDKKSS